MLFFNDVISSVIRVTLPVDLAIKQTTTAAGRDCSVCSDLCKGALVVKKAGNGIYWYVYDVVKCIL
jgi:hypothetical protein